MELNSLWVVLVLIVGVALAFYSICRGWKGLREAQEAADQGGGRITVRSLVAPYSGLVQQLRAEEANQSRLYLISGASVYDKNPPSYEEIIEPPPSYEETIKKAEAMSLYMHQSSSDSPPPPFHAYVVPTHTHTSRATAADEAALAAVGETAGLRFPESASGNSQVAVLIVDDATEHRAHCSHMPQLAS